MVKGFKWLLPGAVKKMTTTQKQKTQTKQNVRKEADNKTNENKTTAASVIFNHLYIHVSMRIRTKSERLSFPFSLTNIHMGNAYLFTLREDENY